MSSKPESADTDGQVSAVALASTALRWRRLILTVAFIGGVGGIVVGRLTTPLYDSSATMLPQASDASGGSGLAAAASQLGIRVPAATGGVWSSGLYAELVRSRSVLGPIAADTFVVPEMGGRRVALADLLDVRAQNSATRLALTAAKLALMVQSSDDKALGTVSVTVSTTWPSVSLALAQRVIQQINDFNLQVRKSQAGEERRFVDEQATEAEAVLNDAESKLQAFLQSNREIGSSPQLMFERDRLQREVALRQTLYTSLLQNREDARIREVRDTPVITVLEAPRLPLKSTGRKTLLKTVAGALLGALVGFVVALIGEGMTRMRAIPSPEVKEFLALADEALPSILRPTRGRAISN